MHWLILLACYFLFTGQFSTAEWIAGTPAALVAAAFVFISHRVANRRLHLEAPWLRLQRGALTALVLDSGRVTWVLWRLMFRRPGRQVGHSTRQDFHEGTNRPADAGRRGLVTLAASLAPNGFVVDIPPGEEALVLHRLVHVPPPGDTLWPL